ncbi:hypothetical protein [Mesoaciditoga lauensis]|uniref:hypothetical protein n=1 Tax=Mesoaciditoga lauensis TaxID=1495039 RepID=UPI00056A57F3|nr:hypothetical protein [Mesoaciditoga lauensis]
MKKMVILTVILISVLALGIFAYDPPNNPTPDPVPNGDSVDVFFYDNGWTTVATPSIAAATATQFFRTPGGYEDAPLDGFSDAMFMPWTDFEDAGFNNLEIKLHVYISKWIRVCLEYSELYIHIDLPGKYYVDNMGITITTNGTVVVTYAATSLAPDQSNNLYDATSGATIETYYAEGTSVPSGAWDGWTTAAGFDNSFMVGPACQGCGQNCETNTNFYLGLDVKDCQPVGNYQGGILLTFVDP